MIPRISTTWQTPAWQTELAQAIRDPKQLLETLELPLSLLPAALQAHQLFPLRAPRSFVQRMQRGKLHDPLLQQVLPIGLESVLTPGYNADPVGDLESQVVPGLLHKYYGRALLVTTSACAIHCRYCFRRHFPYEDARLSHDNEQAILSYLREHKELHEVILSGGDPLSLSDKRLLSLITEIEQIPHIRTLRIHTRLPVVIPSRVTDELLSGLSQSRLQKVIVIHVNHAQEIDTTLKQALVKLKTTGAQLLNQAVLLKGVNDTQESQEALCHALWDAGVLPYYLHVLDKAQGTAHFEVPEICAKNLIEELRARLPGYMVPSLVREIAGDQNKRPL